MDVIDFHWDLEYLKKFDRYFMYFFHFYWDLIDELSAA